MKTSKKNLWYDQYILKGKLRHEGFERWRYIFSGRSVDFDEEKVFFVELYMLNPGISPKNVVIGQKFRPEISFEDLQYSLAGTDSAKNANSELLVKPSYVLVKAGVLGNGGKHINKFVPASHFSFSRAENSFKVDDCFFGENAISGSVFLTSQEIKRKPEYYCDSGAIGWNLRFSNLITSKPLYNKNDSFWIPSGAKSFFEGSINLDGIEYKVGSKNSIGYIDKSWGPSLNVPYFHISCEKILSDISGKSLLNSCIAINGEFNGQLKGFLKIENDNYVVDRQGILSGCNVIFDCSQIPTSENGTERLHWMVSIHKGKVVIDIDVYCEISEMIMKDYEIPQGEKALLKIVSGGTGTGDVRIYKKIHKNLELLEHGKLSSVICELGEIEKYDK